MAHHWPKELLIWHCTILSLGQMAHDYIITNSINSLLIGSRCTLSGAHTNHCWVNLAHCFTKYHKLCLKGILLANISIWISIITCPSRSLIITLANLNVSQFGPCFKIYQKLCCNAKQYVGVSIAVCISLTSIFVILLPFSQSFFSFTKLFKHLICRILLV